MRIPALLLPAAAACCLVASLAACSGASGGTAGPAPAPSAAASAVAAVDLAGTTWRVEEDPGATIHFDGASVTIAKGGGSSSAAWAAQGDRILVGGGTSSLGGPVSLTRLTTATSVARTGDGWVLRNADGATTATLTTAGSASPAPTTATTLLGPAVPGPGVVDVPASAIEGTWTAATDPRSAITFTSGGWRAASSCTSGAVGGRGVYRVLPGGRLLAVRTATPIRGCPIMRDQPVARATAISAIARAASFRVVGDRLTLFDRMGAPLGSLVRG